MKLKKLLPIALLSLGVLVGCKQSDPKPETDKYSVSIANKTEIVAGDWHVGDGTKELSLVVKTKNSAGAWEEGNPLAEYTNGNLKVTTSDANIVSADFVTLAAKGAGKATITVDFHGVKDTVDFTVLAKQTNKEKYGTKHEGNAEDPFDNEDAVKVGLWAKDNGDTEALYVKGKIKSFYHSPGERTDGAVSWFLEPATTDGAKFEVYKCFKADKSALTADDVWLGGEATAYGPITYYTDGSQAEFSSSTFVSCTGDKPEPPKTLSATVTEALTIGAALDDGASTYDWYAITGYVVAMSGSTYYLADDKTETDTAKMFQLFSLEATYTENLLKGAKITITVKIKNYHGTIENAGQPSTAVVVIEPGKPWSYDKKTVTEILAIGAALDTPASKGKQTDGTETYEIDGYVVKKDTYSTSYGNGSFYIADSAAETDTTKMLQVFRVKDQTKFDSLVVGTTTVAVYSNVCKYWKSGDTVETAVFVYETCANPDYDITSAPVEPTKATVTEALAAGMALANPSAKKGETKGTETFAVTGYVVKKDTWSTTYNNANFYIADDASETDTTKMLQAYRFADQTLFESLEVGVTKVTVTSTLVKYWKSGDTVETAVFVIETVTNPATVIVTE